MQIYRGARILMIVMSVAISVAVSHACNTPVFRYALERWEPDNYEVIVLHRQPFTDTQTQLLETLRQATHRKDLPTNMRLRTVDLAQPLDERDQRLLDVTPPAEPATWMLVHYPPFTNTDRPAFAGPFNNDTVQALLDSPARHTVVERIAAGHSVVWILIESGDSAKDEIAERVLRQRLTYLETELQLPESGESNADAVLPSHESFQPTSTDLSLRLSLIRIGRNIQEERIFLSMLINSETDLYEFNEPIAIPVFGRGRSHYALVGKGINDDNIDSSCQYLCGACSCEVKSQNPGVDMLIQANWDSHVANISNIDPPFPSLTGLAALSAVASTTDVATESTPADTTPEALSASPDFARGAAPNTNSPATFRKRLYCAMIMIFVLGVVVISVGTVFIKSRQNRS